MDVERVHPDLGPAGRGILAEQNERRRGRERTNDGRDVGIDVLVDVFSHLGDFTVAPDLRGQVLDNNFSVMSRIFTWAVVEYISVSPSKPIFNRSVLLCRPCLRTSLLCPYFYEPVVLTTFLLSAQHGREHRRTHHLSFCVSPH